MNHIEYLESLGACSEAVEYASQFPALQAAWDACERGDWMLWLLGRTLNKNDEADLRRLTLVKARCAKLVLHLMQDERSRRAVEVAEQFGLGNATREELGVAADAAYAAYVAAYAAAYAVYAAAYAVYGPYVAYNAAERHILERAAGEVRNVFPVAGVPGLENERRK